MSSLLRVDNLHTRFHGQHGAVLAVAGVDLSVMPGEVLALVGESGCGKSATALSIMGLIAPAAGGVSQGQVWFEGDDLLQSHRARLDEIRGKRLAMIFQDPSASLNPVLPIGRQLTEALRKHRQLSLAQARHEALNLLREVGIERAEERLLAYPHELSGGMCQRVMIALAISCRPSLLIADEPTTALDVTVQRQVMDLLDELRRRNHMAMLLITHDLGVVAGYADRVVVMYLGEVVEQASVQALFSRPAHPYTQALLHAMPDLDDDAQPLQDGRLPSIPGSVPDLHERPSGCAFAERCSYASARCVTEAQSLRTISSEHLVRCWQAHPEQTL